MTEEKLSNTVAIVLTLAAVSVLSMGGCFALVGFEVLAEPALEGGVGVLGWMGFAWLGASAVALTGGFLLYRPLRDNRIAVSLICIVLLVSGLFCGWMGGYFWTARVRLFSVGLFVVGLLFWVAAFRLAYRIVTAHRRSAEQLVSRAKARENVDV